MSEQLKLYVHFIKMGFVELLAYRITVIMLAVSIPITLFARYYVFAALYESNTQKIDGYDLRGILTYLVVAWLLRSFFRNGSDRRIGRDVRNGNIVFDLMRPVSFLTLMFFRGLGKSLNRVALISLPLVVIFLATDILQLPSDPTLWARFLIMCALGYLIAFWMQLIIGLLAFFIGYNISIIWTFDLIIQILSGLLLPLHFFPAGFARVLDALPFGHIYYLPTQVFLDQIPAEQFWVICQTGFAWMAGLGMLTWGLFRVALRKLSIAGG
jgi:ABC-2 type transport system permease protein